MSVWIASLSVVGLTGCTTDGPANSRGNSTEVHQRMSALSDPKEVPPERNNYDASNRQKEPVVSSNRVEAVHGDPLNERPVIPIPAAPATTKPIGSESVAATPTPAPSSSDSPAATGSAVILSERAPIPSAPKESAKTVRIPVLNYHSIGTDPGNNAVLEPKKLEEQMAYLAKEGYTPLTLRAFIEIWEGKRAAPPKSVLLTFDDGYADNFEKALPILKKHGFHATMFMSPGSVGDGWYVDWEQAKAMHEAGWDIQPHGMTHVHLNKLPADKAKAEIEESAKQIEAHLGIKAEVFCYPYGAYNKETMQILAENQYKLAFTIDQGFAETSQNPLALKRLFISGSDTLQSFIAKLTKGG